MTSIQRNNRTAMGVILVLTAILLGMYACTGPERPTKPSHPNPKPVWTGQGQHSVGHENANHTKAWTTIEK